jgi:hypothetical protein
MHQPGQRKAEGIAATSGHSLMNPAGADILYDASNYAVTHQQLARYGEKVHDRFPSVRSPSMLAAMSRISTSPQT